MTHVHRNDLKGQMALIEKGLHNLHAQSRETGVIGAMDAMDVSLTAQEIPDTFAIIDLVSPGSPAGMTDHKRHFYRLPQVEAG